MDLNAILIFTRVVQAGSFVRASQELGMPNSTVSRKVSELEERIGIRLLHRTTRKLSLTDEGRAYYRHTERVVAEAEAAELAVDQLQQAPRGLLRVSTPLNFGFLAPATTEFLRRYPEVQLEVTSTDRVIDLIHEGIDLAIRVGNLPDSTLVARQLCVLQSYFVASPGYLRKHGTPKKPEDLNDFQCLVQGTRTDGGHWTLTSGDVSKKVEVSPRLIVNDFDLLDEAVMSGEGIARLPEFRCHAALREGRLKRVLPQWCAPEIQLHAVYPSARYLSPKVKAFRDHLLMHLAAPPWRL